MTKDKINKSRRRLIQSAGTLPIAVSTPITFGNDHQGDFRKYDAFSLDEVYPRWKTDSAKWDLQTKGFPGQEIQAAMGIAC